MTVPSSDHHHQQQCVSNVSYTPFTHTFHSFFFPLSSVYIYYHFAVFITTLFPFTMSAFFISAFYEWNPFKSVVCACPFLLT